MASRSFGGVSITDMSRMPTSDMFSVRGIGVAVMVRTSTFLRICLMRSLWATPKRCSSSTTSKPEILEVDVLRQQAMRADDHVEPAGRQRFERFLDLLLGAEAADHFDLRRERREPLAQGLQVLRRQHGRRRQEGHLLAFHHRLEGRAHRDLGLAVADVAAEQPVHRRGRFHVALDVGDRGRLVRRQGELERVLELLLPVRVGAERVARRRPCARHRASAAPRPCRAWPS